MSVPRRACDTEPSDWKQLQAQTQQLFTEIGCNARESFVAKLVRGQKEIDVFVEDEGVTPPQTYAVECKQWKKPVEQETIHAFRTVCADLGVTIGFVVASGGFQSGAREAAKSTNVRLVTFHELQELFFDRWYRAMLKRLQGPMKKLFPYWDVAGGKMPTFQWGDAERKRHDELQSQYRIVFDADHWVISRLLMNSNAVIPLPQTFRDPFTPDGTIEVRGFRQYFTLVDAAYPKALREMQLLHGERPE